MPPSAATESAWPVKRVVPTKADATPSRDRSTEPITADVFGVLKAAMPTPTTASESMTRAVEA